jgi:hypothetical protein
MLGRLVSLLVVPASVLAFLPPSVLQTGLQQSRAATKSVTLLSQGEYWLRRGMAASEARRLMSDHIPLQLSTPALPWPPC